MLFRPRVVQLGLLLGVVAAISLALAAELDARRNPMRRDPSTWTVADARALLEDPALHWCDGYHGHSFDRGPTGRCKGRRFRTFRALEARFSGDPVVEDLLLGRLADRDDEVVAQAAELLGTWRTVRAEEPLLGQLRRRLESLASAPSHADERCAISLVWALERVSSARELYALEPRAAEGSRLVRDQLRHAVEALRAGGCACGAPHRR